MKKIILTIGLALGLCFGTQASQLVFQSVIPGSNRDNRPDLAGEAVAMLLNSNITAGIVSSTNFLNPTTNGLTNSWGSAGVVYAVSGNASGYTYGTNAILMACSTGRFAASSSIITSTNVQYVNPSATTLYGTNQLFYQVHALGSTNSLGANIDPQYWNDIDVYYDGNGAAIPLTLTASYGTDQNSANATNGVTFTFIGSYDGLTFVTNNTFAVGGTTAALSCNGTNTVSSTNTISSSSLTGYKKLRLWKYVVGTNTLADSVWCYSLGASSAKP